MGIAATKVSNFFTFRSEFWALPNLHAMPAQALSALRSSECLELPHLWRNSSPVEVVTNLMSC